MAGEGDLNVRAPDSPGTVAALIYSRASNAGAPPIARYGTDGTCPPPSPRPVPFLHLAPVIMCLMSSQFPDVANRERIRRFGRFEPCRGTRYSPPWRENPARAREGSEDVLGMRVTRIFSNYGDNKYDLMNLMINDIKNIHKM